MEYPSNVHVDINNVQKGGDVCKDQFKSTCRVVYKDRSVQEIYNHDSFKDNIDNAVFNPPCFVSNICDVFVKS